MKLILPRVKQALLFTCFSTFLFAQQTGKKDYKNTLIGNVKSVRITTYVALDKGGGKCGKGSVAKGMDNFLISYDKKGNVTDRVAYYTNGKVWYTKKYVYEGSDIPKEVPEKMTVQPKEKVALRLFTDTTKKDRKLKNLLLTLKERSSGAMYTVITIRDISWKKITSMHKPT